MKIGITYDLRSEWLALGYSELETAEFDREETVDAVDAALRAEGFETERIGNFRSLIPDTVAGSGNVQMTRRIRFVPTSHLENYYRS